MDAQVVTEATSMEYASLINYIGINKAIHMPEKLWVQGLYTTWPVQQAALLPEGLTITLIFEIHVLYKLSLSSMKIISFFPPYLSLLVCNLLFTGIWKGNPESVL